MQVKFEIFKSSMKSWQNLCAEAVAFASNIGRDRLINLSVSEDHNTGAIHPRNADCGSTFDARRAGSALATSATAIIARAATT